MLYTPHFLTGAAIVKFIPNPVVGLPLALASHFVLDMIPHYDFDIEPGMTRDFLLSKKFKQRKLFLLSYGVDIVLFMLSILWVVGVFGVFRVGQNNWWFLTGGITATLPDAIEQGIVLLGFKLTSWQDKFQWKVSARYGFVSYPVVSLLALYFLLH